MTKFWEGFYKEATVKEAANALMKRWTQKVMGKTPKAASKGKVDQGYYDAMKRAIPRTLQQPGGKEHMTAILKK